MKNDDAVQGGELIDHSAITNGYPDPSLENPQSHVTVPSRLDHNHQALSLANIHNDVLNGKIVFSRDTEGSDLPKGTVVSIFKLINTSFIISLANSVLLS